MSDQRAGHAPTRDHLVISLPDCPGCLREVACDGSSYWCEGCGATWDMNGTSTVEDPEGGLPVSLAPADRPSWAICDRCKVGDHDGCTVPETNEECCCGA